MPRKTNPQNQNPNALPKQAISKRVRKPKPQQASNEQIRDLVEKRFLKQKRANNKQNKKIPTVMMKACLQAQHLNCSICLELMVKPTSLCCGHSFCLPCIQKLNKTEMRYKCSLCRQSDNNLFYEIDNRVEKLLLYIKLYKLKQMQKIQYNVRKGEIEKQFAARGLAHRLNTNDQVKIKLRSGWEKGRIVSVRQINSDRYYTVQVGFNKQRYTLEGESVNLALTEDYIRRMKEQPRGIFSQNIFIEDYVPRPPINNTYNIQQLLWEVNYYSPIQNNYNGWDFSPQVVQEHLSQEESESVQFLGRSIFGSNMADPINID